MAAPSPAPRRPGRHPWLPIALVALGPVVWFTHLSVAYWLVPVACRGGSNLPLYAVTAAAVVIGLGGVGVALRLRTSSEQPPTTSWLTRGAIALGAYFTLVVAVTTLIFVILEPCG